MYKKSFKRRSFGKGRSLSKNKRMKNKLRSYRVSRGGIRL